MNLQPLIFAALFGCFYYPKVFGSDKFYGKYSKLTGDNLRRRIQSIEERNRRESTQEIPRNQETQASSSFRNSKLSDSNPKKDPQTKQGTKGESSKVQLQLSRNSKTSDSSNPLQNAKSKETSQLLRGENEGERSSMRESPSNRKMSCLNSTYPSSMVDKVSNQLAKSKLFKPIKRRFLDSKKLSNLYDEWMRDNFYELDMNDLYHQINESLKKCEISDQTKLLFEMGSDEISLTNEVEEYRRVTTNEICDRIGKQFHRKKTWEGIVEVADQNGRTNVELGFTGMKKGLTYFGECYKLFGLLDIYLGPKMDNKQFYFVVVISENTRKVMDSLYTKEGVKKRMFQKVLKLRKSVECYYDFQREVEKRKLAISYTSEDKSKRTVPQTYFYISRDRYPTKEVQEIFAALSTSEQPNIDSTEDNEAVLDGICKQISTLTGDRKYNDCYNDQFVYRRSEFLQGRHPVHHTIRLYDSIDTVQNILLFGKCHFQKHKEVIYVYLATKKDYEEKYLLAIKQGDGKTVAVDSLRADVTKIEVYL